MGPPFDRNKNWRRGSRISSIALIDIRVFDLVIFYLDFQVPYIVPESNSGRNLERRRRNFTGPVFR